MTALKIATSDDAQPTAEIYTVTPAVAKRWLSRNVRNRKTKPGSIAAYARDMKAGRWQLTGEAIKFDTNGALSDGQNRLHAVIKSGISVQMLVVRGIAPEAQAVMDSGTKRSVNDQLVMAGVSNPSIISAAARLALSEPACGFALEEMGSKVSITNSEIAEFIADQGERLSEAARIASHYYPAIDCPPSVLAVAWMRFANIDAQAAADFMTAIADMRTDGPGDPRYAYAYRLGNVRKNKERVNQVAHLSLIFRAWNAWREGKQIKNLPVFMGTDLVRVPTRLK